MYKIIELAPDNYRLFRKGFFFWKHVTGITYGSVEAAEAAMRNDIVERHPAYDVHDYDFAGNKVRRFISYKNIP